jgi:hypothetical protein
MCMRLSSRDKKKNRNSPSRKTVGDKQSPQLLLSIASLRLPRQGNSSFSTLIRSGQGLCEAAVCIFLTLAITWPQVVKAEVFCLAEAAQVNGGVREWQECQVQQEVRTAQSPSP